MLPRGRRSLLVASTGGHLAQLVLVSQMLDVHPDSVWVTFDSAQSRSLLAGRRVRYVPYIEPRGLGAALRAVPHFDRLLHEEQVDAVLSTGAAIAAPALAVAAARRVPAFYLESVSRFDGPSLTGRVVARIPGVHCYTQHPGWAGGRWSYDLSVTSRLTARRSARSSVRLPGGTRCFVTLGTIEPYRFDAVVDNLLAVLPEDAEVTWQLGSTVRSDLPGRVTRVVAAEEFDRLATEADVVITHAGVGSALRLLDLGVAPVLVPRRRSRGEHVDDHQAQAARELERAGLVLVREAGEITAADLEGVAAGRLTPAGVRELAATR